MAAPNPQTTARIYPMENIFIDKCTHVLTCKMLSSVEVKISFNQSIISLRDKQVGS